MEFRSHLTPVQQGMLTHSIDKENRHCYIIQTVFEWEERIVLTSFEAAWKELARRHEALRSRFEWKETAAPEQIVSAETLIDFQVQTSAARSSADRQAHLQSFLDGDLARGFTLEDSTPWRVTAIQYADGKVTAVWTFHHLLLDGRSHALLLKELLALYDAAQTDRQVNVVAEAPHRLHADWLEKQDFAHTREYWRAYLKGLSEPAAFPGEKRAKPAALCVQRDSQLGAALTRELKAFSTGTGLSVGNIIQASWAFVLGWLANEPDAVIGAVRACRKSGIDNGDRVIGVMINTLPLRLQWNASSTIEETLRRVGKDWHDFREVEQTPLQQIRGWLGLPSGRELFTAVVSYSAPHFLDGVFGSDPAREQRRIWLRQTTPYCSFDAGLGQGDLAMSFNLPGVAMDLAEQFPDFLRNTIRQMIANPRLPVSALSPLADRQRRDLIFATNSRWEPAPTLIDWLERLDGHAAEQPEKTALEGGGQALSWKELQIRSNQWAAFLRDQGVTAGRLVAVFLPRSVEFVCACLGILKTGAAYLPLDTQWPIERIANILQDAQARGTVTSDDLLSLLPAERGPWWTSQRRLADYSGHTLEGVIYEPEQLSYVIYTSGSSGTPKGVEITQRGLQNLIEDAMATFSLRPSDRGSFLSSPAFDASVHEVWPLLAAGASVHLPDDDLLQNPVGLLRWMGGTGITIAFVSVIIAESLTQLARGRSLALRYLLTGADQLRMAQIAGLCFQLVNEYGPTEYSVVATRYEVRTSFDGSAPIPIGKPLRGTRIYVMNRFQQLLPRGVSGELVLAGGGAAKGYRHQPDLTAQKFVDNPLAEEPARTLYRSGDLARWLPDGNLQFLGRLDSQVKLRGFRIELGEIEAVLLKQHGVAEAVVVLRSDPTPRLVAFVVPDGALSEEQLPPYLTEQLRKLLPDYMAPSHFIFLDRLPINTSGKYDRRQLAALSIARAESKPEPAVFHSPVEKEMASLWEEVLGVPTIGPGDRFLSMGGTSLSIIKLISAIDLRFGAEIPASELFRDPTPGDLAKLINGNQAVRPKALVPLHGQGRKSPVFCVPGAGGGVHWFRHLAEAMEFDRPVVGVELLALSEKTQRAFSVESAAEEIAELVASFGDWRECSLCGYSGGGLLALEAARKLRDRAKHVQNVFLLDTYPPEHSRSDIAKAIRWLRGWWSLPPGQRIETIKNRLNWLRKNSAQPHGATQLEKDVLAIKHLHIEAFKNHRLQPSDERVRLFFAEDRPLSVRSSVHQNWSRFLSGPFWITQLPGDHYSLLKAGNAQRLATYFAEILDSRPSDSFGKEPLDSGAALARPK